MQRILFAVGLVVVVAASVFVFPGTQPCGATSIATSSAVAIARAGDDAGQPFIPRWHGSAESREDEPLLLAADGSQSPFLFTAEQASAGDASSPEKSVTRTIRSSRSTTVYSPRQVTVDEDHLVIAVALKPRQRQFVELMVKQAQRMTDEELKAAIEKVEAELQQQDEQAEAELHKAIKILYELKEGAAGTPAARRAASALPLLDGTKPPSDQPYVDPNAIQFGEPIQPSNPVPTY